MSSPVINTDVSTSMAIEIRTAMVPYDPAKFCRGPPEHLTSHGERYVATYDITADQRNVAWTIYLLSKPQKVNPGGVWTHTPLNLGIPEPPYEGSHAAFGVPVWATPVVQSRGHVKREYIAAGNA